MQPHEYFQLTSSARHVRDRLSTGRGRRFRPPPSWPRARGPEPNNPRNQH
jgi:hypothetical protein